METLRWRRRERDTAGESQIVLHTSESNPEQGQLADPASMFPVTLFHRNRSVFSIIVFVVEFFSDDLSVASKLEYD